MKNIVNSLLENNQKQITKILNQKIKWLKTATGEQCPNCYSKNVRTDRIDYGICEDCDNSFEF